MLLLFMRDENKLNMIKYKAEYGSSNRNYKTRYYPTREQAQDALMKRVGRFHYLGKVNGDGRWKDKSYCDAAPRNGGLVAIQEKEVA